MNGSILLEKLKHYKQNHILAHLSGLNVTERKRFIAHATNLDIDLIFSLYNNHLKSMDRALHLSDIGTASIIAVPERPEDAEKALIARKDGEKLIAENRVAVLIVAGGQGSRLGFPGPKGTLPISPVKNKTLFQLFAEQVRAVSARYNARLPLLIMTSQENHTDTRKFFAQNRNFGLGPSDIHFFPQGIIPSITPEGRLILKDRLNLFSNPDGHGGSLKALHESGLLEMLINKGYTTLFYCQVDNPLVRIADPVFLGYHRLHEAQISTKVVRREDTSEKVGVYVRQNGKDAVVEYSELGDAFMSALDEHGNILYWAGNTAIHAIDLFFIRQLNEHGFVLPYHRAVKDIDTFDSGGSPVTVKGWKFETFVFDAISLARNPCCMEVLRREEFAPVKNAEGADSPETAKKAMTERDRNRLSGAGIRLADNIHQIEISPLFALDGDDYIHKLSQYPLTGSSDGLYIE